MKLLFSLCLFFFGASLLHGTEFLVENGRARAQIIIPNNPPRTVRLAAEELQSSLKEITGAELPISHAAEKEWPVQIYVGASDLTKKLGIEAEGLRNGAFRMVSGPGWLAFLGGDADYAPNGPVTLASGEEEAARVLKEWDRITGERYGNPMLSMWRKRDAKTGLWEFDLDNAGSYNAVCRFLHDLGMRWYQPGPVGQVTPALASIPLPKVDRTVRPDFPLRNLYIHGGNFMTGKKEMIAWEMRLGLNQGQDLIGFGPNVAVSHGIKWPITREEIKKSMPELYMLRNGERQTEKGIPCLSSEALFKRNVDYLRNYFDTYDVPMASVMPTDGFMALCECSLCEGKSTPGRGFYGVLSDYVWDYVVRVANEIAKTHPDKKIHCLAYTSYLLPPEKIDKFPPNLVVGMAQSPSSFHVRKTKEFYRTARAAWLKKLTTDVPLYQYEYYLHGWRNRWPGVPVIYPRLIVEDLRALKGVSMGNYIEVFPNPSNYINAYVTARFSWDVNLDLDAEMDEYYRLFYGPAAAPMKAFLEFCEARWMEIPNSPELIARTLELVAAARKEAGEGIYGKRVAQFEAFVAPLLQQKERLLQKTANAREIHVADLADVPKGSIVLDGSLDDPAWQAVPGDGMRPIPPNEEKGIATVVKMAWTEGGLYVGVRCEEPEMEKVSLKVTSDGDMNLWVTDCVEIMLETQSHSHYQIAVSPMGAIVDVDRSAGIDTLWTSGAKVATTRGKDHWIVEAFIPVAEAVQGEVDLLNGVAGNKPTEREPWYGNVGRTRWVTGESLSFSLSGHGFHDKLHFARFVVPGK